MKEPRDYKDYLNYDSDLKIVELTEDEFKAIKFKDKDKYSTKKCYKEMDITEKDFEKILDSAREKVATALISEKCLRVIIKEDVDDNNIIKEENLFEMKYCKFRCSICGCIYYVNYEIDDIICPKCSSKKVMTSEDAGFCKKWIYNK